MSDEVSVESYFSAFGLSYGYHVDEPVVKEVSFELDRGEIIALLGPNGCGKSTLMKAAARLLPVRKKGNEGQVRIRGKDYFSLPASDRARLIAYVPPDFRTEFPLTAYETVSLGRSAFGRGVLKHESAEDRDAVAWAMKKAYCEAFADRDVHTLSGGERQLVALARALAQGAKILFLDETLSRMDLNHQALIGKLLRELASDGWAVLLVAHDVNLATEWADYCMLMQSGKKIAFGSPKEILTEERVRALYPGANLSVGQNPFTGAPKVFFGKP